MFFKPLSIKYISPTLCSTVSSQKHSYITKNTLSAGLRITVNLTYEFFVQNVFNGFHMNMKNTDELDHSTSTLKDFGFFSFKQKLPILENTMDTMKDILLFIPILNTYSYHVLLSFAWWLGFPFETCWQIRNAIKNQKLNIHDWILFHFC